MENVTIASSQQALQVWQRNKNTSGGFESPDWVTD